MENALYLLGLIIVALVAILIFRPKPAPWEQNAARSAPVGSNWFVRLFESEGEPSIRLILAPIVVVFSLVMQALAKLTDNQLEANYFLAATLLGLGTAKLVGKAFAQRPPAAAPQIRAETADVSAAGDANIINQGKP